MKEKKSKKIVYYIVIILSILFVAGLGSLFVNLGMKWFDFLNKPSQFPPNFVIPIVWTVIYAIFAVVLCLIVWKQKLQKKTFVLLIINGVLNIVWCLIFFTLNQTFLGLISILLLAVFAYILVLDIKQYKNLYLYLTAIYPIWATIATCLNVALWILN